MIFLQFIILTLIVVIGAINISKQAQIIESNSKLNSAIIGIVLAFTTSLPELAIGFTSIFINQPELTMGDVLGSNVLNCLILAGVNIIFYSKVVLANTSKSARRINIFSILIYILLLLAYVFSNNGVALVLFDSLSIVSIVIIIIYVFAVKSTSDEKVQEEALTKKDKTLYKKAVIKFLLLASLILISSILLTQTANEIVYITGLKASVVGAFFIAFSTSLPEVMTCSSLVKANKFTMATTSIWGSNLFNFAILATIDIFSPNPLISLIDSNLLKLIIIGLIFVIIQSFQPLLKNKYKKLNITPSIFMFVLYIAFFLI